MSADVEAAKAKSDAEEATAHDTTAPETTTTEGNGNLTMDDEKRADEKHENGAGREVDEKYSKKRHDTYKNKRSGNFRGHNNFNKRPKFDGNNVKSRYDNQEKTDDPIQIRKQVEFYFSDGNLHQDKFLFEQIGGSDNRPVDIKVIASFKRMQRFEPYSAIINALKGSSTLEVLNEDKPNDEQVRRRIPLPENFGKSHEEVKANYDTESMKRSIYVKGFGAETAKTQIEVEDLFAPYMASAVRLRRANDGTFKGSVFVEFETEDDMQQFLELEEKPEWEGKKLDIKSKEDYCKEKDKLINEGKIRRNDLDADNGPRSGWRNSKGGYRGRDKGGRRYNDRRNRDHSRSRSRSKERRSGFQDDLKRKSWRELADEEDKEREAKKHKSSESVQTYDDAGISKVDNEAGESTSVSTNGKKRTLEEDSAQDGGETKKVKADE